jgi:hypothetical protein
MLTYNYHLSFDLNSMIFFTIKSPPKNDSSAYLTCYYSLFWSEPRHGSHINIVLDKSNIADFNPDIKLVKYCMSIGDRGKTAAVMEKKARPDNLSLTQLKISKSYSFDQCKLFVGTFFYICNESTMDGYREPYFSIFTENGTFLTATHQRLIKILSINGQYYIVSHFQKPESGGRSLCINRIMNNRLAEAFCCY